MFLILSHVRHAGMWIHADNPAVSYAAISALLNVSAYSETNQVLEIRRDDLDAIVNAMRAHQNAKGVQQKALTLLMNLTVSRDNIIVMEQNPYLVPLIRLARSKWQTTFEEQTTGHVNHLLRVLPASNQ